MNRLAIGFSLILLAVSAHAQKVIESKALNEFSDEKVSMLSTHIFAPQSNLSFLNFRKNVGHAFSFGDKFCLTDDNDPKSGLRYSHPSQRMCEDFDEVALNYNKPWALSEPQSKAMVSEMNRINKLYNGLLNDRDRALKLMKSPKKDSELQRLEGESEAFWQIFMSCVAYASTGSDWDTGKPSEWKSKQGKGGGIFRLNVAGLFHDDANACVHEWNKLNPSRAIEYSRFQKDEKFRADTILNLDQDFNTMCASHLLMRNMVFQAHMDRAGCVNPFMRRLNILPVFAGTPSPEIFSCTKRLLNENGKFKAEVASLSDGPKKTSGDKIEH